MHSVTRSCYGYRNVCLLLLWGGGILWMAASGRLPAYLHPSLQPFTIAAGLLLLLMSGFAILKLAAKHPHSHSSCGCDHDQPDGHHDHQHREGLTGFLFKTLILLIPILVLLSGNSDRFTTTTVANRGIVQDLEKLPAARSAVSAPKSDSLKEPTGRPMPLQVIDLLYALQMPSYREEFEGKEVELTAQYVPMTTGNPRGDRFQAVRMFITCCAADAKPVGVTVRATVIPNVPEMGWLKITGRPTFPMEGGKRTAILEAMKIDPCDAPSEPFVY